MPASKTNLRMNNFTEVHMFMNLHLICEEYFIHGMNWFILRDFG